MTTPMGALPMQVVLDRLLTAIPEAGGWEGALGEPYGPYHINPGAQVRKVLYCVTPTRAVTERVVREEYDLLISHHPFVDGRVPQLVLHTALDCCPGGLNDQWRDALGLRDARHFDGRLGWYGDIEPMSFDELVVRCEAFCGAPLLGQLYTRRELIRSVVICTGLGGMVTRQARSTGADCYILGEATGPAASMGFEAVIEIGHTLSEQVGVHLVRRLLPELVVDLAPLAEDVFGREVHARRPSPISRGARLRS
jgi:putative NIF3 family GTP cyclohydrolase 1 type 2